MYYEQHGEGRDVVLLAGLAADSSIWEHGRFGEGWRVTILDNRGSGRSGSPSGSWSIEGMAEDVAALCAALGLNQAAFVGHSMGGHIAQWLAVKHPALVRRMVLACSEQEFSIISDLATRQQLALIDHGLPRELLVRNYLPTLFSRGFLADEARREGYVRSALAAPAPPLAGYRRQVKALRRHDTRAIVASIACPVLVLGCEEDLLTPPGNSAWLAAHIPGARLEIIPGSGHVPFIEKPAEFYRRVTAFLGGEE